MFSNQKIKHLKNSKFKNYLTYALGEIVLIVIGISIAVYINKSIENSNQEKLLQSILTTISNDIELDIKDVDIIINNYELQEQYYDYVLDSLDVGKKMKDCPRCPSVLTSAMPFSLRSRGYQQLVNYKEYNFNTSDSLIFGLSNFYSSYTKYIEIVNDLLLEDTNENLDYLKINYKYFKYLLSNEEVAELMDFFENNTEFINRVALREVISYNNHFQLLKTYKKDSKKMLESINLRLK